MPSIYNCDIKYSEVFNFFMRGQFSQEMREKIRERRIVTRW